MQTETEVRPIQEDSTDLSVFVRTSKDNIVQWDKEKIIRALVRETGIKREIANIISVEVEKQIQTLAVKNITAPLIRELVDVKLLEYGLEEARRQHTRLGTPAYDVKKMMYRKNKENANTPHTPEATNLTLAENIKKEFALLNVFSPEVADAHMTGLIHLHDLGFVDRPYCSGQSVEYIKKFGLDLPDAPCSAHPAVDAEELIDHLVKFSLALHGHFAGAIGWDAVNMFMAPYLEGLGKGHIKKLARKLITEFAFIAVSRGGQGLFSDLNIYYEIPKHFENTPAIGRCGKDTGKVYSEYKREAQDFARAMFEVYLEGDAAGRPFFFPKPLVHMTEKFFQEEGHDEFLRLISEVAAVMGNTYFVFDRGETAKISECCRLSFKLDASDLEDAKHPWKMRYSALQNATINLPRIAYLAKKDNSELYNKIGQVMEITAEAHMQKRKFLIELLNEGKEGPLALLASNRDGEAYLRLRRCTHLIGVLGLNEMVQYHIGQELHESKEALKLGLKITSFMKLKSEELSKKFGAHFVLEQTPAESTAYRFAKLDQEHFPEQSHGILKGNLETNEIYYTNSTYFNVSHHLNSIDRVCQEGLIHPLIEAGALTHIWLGESRPNAESLANFVIKTFRETQNAQIAFSPEFTSCGDCGKTARGLKEKCTSCSSVNVEGITRITGYFSRVKGWNKGKVGELKDRHKTEV